MADNLGPMAWLFLQENVQVQYLQKIAQMREAAHFPAAETGHLARSLLPFSPSCLFFI